MRRREVFTTLGAVLAARLAPESGLTVRNVDSGRWLAPTGEWGPLDIKWHCGSTSPAERLARLSEAATWVTARWPEA